MASHSSKVNSVTTVLNVWLQSSYIKLRIHALGISGLTSYQVSIPKLNWYAFLREGKRKRDC